VWQGGRTLIHDPSYGGSGTGRGEADDVVVVSRTSWAVSRTEVPERSRQTDSRGQADDHESRKRCRGQEPGKAQAGIVVGDRRLRSSSGIR